jgi:hypothetical protein
LSNNRFEIIDRRRQNKGETAAPEIISAAATETTGNKSTWKDVPNNPAYMVVLVGSNAGPLVSGRAIGLRADEKFFIADYFLPPIYPEHFDWTVESRKRLDTFLDCDCTSAGPCGVHEMYLPQWLEQDKQRLEMIGSRPVPEPVEVMMKADQARRASQIAIPR